MKRWQKAWLLFILSISVIHSIRDFEQTVGIINRLSTVLVKENGTHQGIWFSANTVLIEGFWFFSSVYLLYQSKFGKLGYFTIFTAISTIVFFFIYWFLV